MTQPGELAGTPTPLTETPDDDPVLPSGHDADEDVGSDEASVAPVMAGAEELGELAGQPGGLAAIREGFKALDREHWVMLFLLGTTMFFDGYDRGVVLVALKQIRATFGLTQSAASWWLALLYLGALPAVPLTRQADRLGRKRLLIGAVIGYTIANGPHRARPRRRGVRGRPVRRQALPQRRGRDRVDDGGRVAAGAAPGASGSAGCR